MEKELPPAAREAISNLIVALNDLESALCAASQIIEELTEDSPSSPQRELKAYLRNGSQMLATARLQLDALGIPH